MDVLMVLAECLKGQSDTQDWDGLRKWEYCTGSPKAPGLKA